MPNKSFNRARKPRATQQEALERQTQAAIVDYLRRVVGTKKRFLDKRDKLLAPCSVVSSVNDVIALIESAKDEQP
jgi:hypothetical protein